MTQFETAAILNQQVPANQIRQTRTLFEAIMSGHRATWSKLGTSEEIAHLLKWSAILQGKTQQTGNHVVQTDQFRRAVGSFHAEKDFCRLLVVMDAEIERALAGNFDFLRDMIAAGGKGTTRSRSVDYIVHAVCKLL